MRQRTEEDPSSKTSNRISEIRKKALILGLAASAVFGVTACSSPEVSASPPTAAATVEAPTNTPDATPTPEVQPTTAAELVNPEGPAENILELGTYALLSPENQGKMHELFVMDILTFRAQPYEEQVAFCKQILDNMIPMVDYQLENNNIKDLHYTETPTTAKEIHDNAAYISIVAARLIDNDANGERIFESELALKMASLGQDVRITDEGLWDSVLSQVNMDNLWSFESMVREFRTNVTSESFAADGTVTYGVVDELNNTGLMTSVPIKYNSMMDGSPQTIYVATSAVNY